MSIWGLVLVITHLVLATDFEREVWWSFAPRHQRLLDQKRAEAIIHKWHQGIQGIKRVTVTFEETHYDQAFQTSQVFVGTFRYMKPAHAAIEIHNKVKGTLESKMMYNGQTFFSYNTKEKVIVVIPKEYLYIPWLAKPVIDSYSVLFLGAPLADMKKMYDIKVTEDKWYFFIAIKPHPVEAYFACARIALRKNDFLPRQIWVKDYSGNETTWDLSRVDLTTDLRHRDFLPAPSSEWRIRAIPQFPLTRSEYDHQTAQMIRTCMLKHD